MGRKKKAVAKPFWYAPAQDAVRAAFSIASSRARGVHARCCARGVAVLVRFRAKVRAPPIRAALPLRRVPVRALGGVYSVVTWPCLPRLGAVGIAARTGHSTTK